MAQAAMPASPFISTALYIRLSVEDNNKRGNSIETQKLVLEKFLLGKPELRLYDIYIDNGATGTNFNRDGFQRMLSDIESGKVGCVIVKDLSRLGRNAIDTGYYIERYFPSHNVRFISVTDQFDSENPDNLHGGIILWYARFSSGLMKKSPSTGLCFCSMKETTLLPESIRCKPGRSPIRR